LFLPFATPDWRKVRVHPLLPASHDLKRWKLSTFVDALWTGTSWVRAVTRVLQQRAGGEKRALDALIVLALRGDLAPDFIQPLPEDAERFLTPEARRALKALGPDVVARIVRGEVRHRPLRRIWAGLEVGLGGDRTKP
jgi:hypothetical protein